MVLPASSVKVIPMRLTLRTLLAYMDGVLEPADAENIEEKIQESEFASGIVNRVRDVVRQLRLGAPKLRGKEKGLDPNTVAEYLDNTLPTEQVPDFEKVCLESDTHLAEVAACHQVLTLVLGEPAEVTSESRERMYGLIHQTKKPAVEAVKKPPAKEVPADGKAAVDGSPQIEELPRVPREKPEIPAYLREPSRRRMWPVAAALLLLTMLACVAVLAVGPQNLIAFIKGQPDAEEVAPAAVAESETTSLETPAEQPANTNLEDGPRDLAPLDNVPVPATDETVAKESETAVGETELAIEPPVPGAMPGTATPNIEVPTEQKPSATNVVRPGMTEPATVADDEAIPEPPEPAPSTPVVAQAAKPGEDVPSLLGRFVSNRTVLLKFDGETSAWKRLPSRAAIGPGDRLLAMPAFNATLALGSGINLDLLGGSMVEFGPPDANGTPQLTIHYGRVVLMKAGGDQVGIHLLADGQQGWLELSGPNSIAAVEAVRTLPPGSDPEAEPAPLFVRLYVSQGDVTWRTTEDAQPRTLTAPFQNTLGSDNQTPEQSLPQWLTQDTTPLIERRGAEFIEEHLAPDRQIVLRAALKELVGHRRSEVKALAARCLAYLGVYEPIINALGNPTQHAAWPALIDELARAIARSTQEATDVREAFELHRGAEGAKLFRLLWGYSTQQLRNGEARELVAGLDHEAIDVRVLSFWNLHRLTGEKNAYRADHTATRRRLPVQKWREQLEAGEIVSWDEEDDEGDEDDDGEANVPSE